MKKIKKRISEFSVFFDYCKDYKRSDKTLSEVKKNENFIKFMNDLNKKNVLKGLEL